MNEIFMAIAMRKIPFKLYMRIVPCVDRSGDILNRIVSLTEQVQIPRSVYLFHIPILVGKMLMKLSHTVVDIEGKERVEAIVIAEVGPDRKPIPGTEIRYECDTLLLSCGLLPENELSRSAGVDLSPITSGPVVNDSLETNIDGIFACGNVLHVHDLVDYVSQEATTAGKNAANYIKNGKNDEAKEVKIFPEGGVRYTVPATIRPTEMDDTLTVRFRVADVYKNYAICTYFDNELISKRKRPVMAPGEMEQVILTKAKLAEYPELDKITITLEEA